MERHRLLHIIAGGLSGLSGCADDRQSGSTEQRQPTDTPTSTPSPMPTLDKTPMITEVSALQTTVSTGVLPLSIQTDHLLADQDYSVRVTIETDAGTSTASTSIRRNPIGEGGGGVKIEFPDETSEGPQLVSYSVLMYENGTQVDSENGTLSYTV